jgi:flagellar biosynthesis/type III secretory pathway ATPase
MMQEAAAVAREHEVLYRRNEDIINIGAYRSGNNRALDDAIRIRGPLVKFLRQRVDEIASLEQTSRGLKEALS